jgi:hypothetical protein
MNFKPSEKPVLENWDILADIGISWRTVTAKILWFLLDVVSFTDFRLATSF